MIRILNICALLLGLLSSAFGQSTPNLTYKQVPTAAQWNSYFAAKQDVLGFVPLSLGGGTLLGPLVTMVPTTGGAGLNLPLGSVPASPRDGDVWNTTAGMFVQINGSTVGPLGTGGGGGGGGSGTVTSVGFAAGSGLAVSGSTSPIATSGSFTYSLAPVGTSTVLGNVSGITQAPSALSTTQLTSLVNPATASLSGALPAWPNNTTTYFRGDGNYSPLNCAAITNAGSICTLGIGSGLQSTGGNLAIGTTVATLNTADQVLTGGANVTTFINSTGNITLDCGVRPLQFIQNGGAFTITAPSNDGSCALQVSNFGGFSGALTIAGYAVGSNTGDTFSTSLRETATCTITIASPAVVTYTGHGLPNNWPLLLATTGALPTGLAAATVYYTSSVATNTFQLSATPGGSAINTSGSQSGTQTCNIASVYDFQSLTIRGLSTYSWKALQ